ncbi:hypothetical protein [Streptomyces africanus]|uniref:hypothetical protein n=1 Tax=Streptomyces africanus TaxID=231024 RepID=UPI001302B265|nr:hypothetical protein [Streptomyces africanus]
MAGAGPEIWDLHDDGLRDPVGVVQAIVVRVALDQLHRVLRRWSSVAVLGIWPQMVGI